MAHGIGVPRTHMTAAVASTSASSIPTTIPATAPPDMPASPSRPPLLPDGASTVSSTPTGVGEEAIGKTAGCSLVPVPSPLSPEESSLVGVVLPVSIGAAVVLAPPSDVAAGDVDGGAVVVKAEGAGV